MHALNSAFTMWLQTLSAVFMVGVLGSTTALAFSLWEDLRTILGRE